MTFMEKQKKESSIVKRMMLAVAGGFLAGFICLFLREFLNGNGQSGVWKAIEAILFQDITATNGIEGLGLFYYAGTADGNCTAGYHFFEPCIV